MSLEPQVWQRQFALLSLPLVLCMEEASILRSASAILDTQYEEGSFLQELPGCW